MDSASAFFNHHHPLKNLQRLSSPVQRHLLQVYSTLAAALVISGFGVYLHVLWGIGGLLTSLGFIVSSIWLMATPSAPQHEGKKLTLLIAAAVFQGASLGPLVELVLEFDGRILVTAFLGTAVIFACFSGAAIFAKRREFLYLGGILASAVSTFLWLQIAATLFGGASLFYMLEVYGGLLLFIGYVLYDTQLIIEKADHGDLDYLKHALDLFVDFAAIFVRLLVILTKNSSEKEERARRQKRGNTSRR